MTRKWEVTITKVFDWRRRENIYRISKVMYDVRGMNPKEYFIRSHIPSELIQAIQTLEHTAKELEASDEPR